MEEVWKDIEGFQGCYQVSNLGMVKGLNRYVPCGKNGGVRLQKGCILSTSENEKGYLRVRISRSRKEKYTFLVHRLVAKAFIENQNNYPQVNHIDGNKKNNNVSNLEWCNNSYNQIHAYAHGLNDQSKYDAGRPKRKVAQIDIHTKEIIFIYESISNASIETDTQSSLIRKVCKGERSKTKGYKWRYATEDMKIGDKIID